MAKLQRCLMCADVMYEMNHLGEPAGGHWPERREDLRYGTLLVCPHCDTEHLTVADTEGDLEQRQLEADGSGLAEEDPRRVEPRQSQRVTSAVGGFDREATLDRQEGREDHRDPEEAGGRFGEESPVGVKGEGEDDQHQQRVRGNLVGRDPRAQLDAKVLSGHERGVTKHAAASF